jgi:RNA ligase (TIGR02306 family)
LAEVERKLASIRIITEIMPIEGADNIVLAIVDGWQCIIKKGEFTEGQLCVYFEIDSFLPIRPEFEFLRKSSYKKMGDKEGFRLKTIRLRGQLSQGLALGIKDVFPEDSELINREGCKFPSIVGMDVTEELGILKYEPPIPAQLAGKVKGYFPSFIRKTDQERVQNIWNKVKDSKESFEVSIKLDGTSCTYYYNNGVFGVCSRNLELIEQEGNTLWDIAKACKVEERLREHGKNIALQGEVIGGGIQGNPENIRGQQFYLFDIWDIDNQCYYRPKERWLLHFISFHVPVIYQGLTLENFNCLNDLLIFADGKSLNSPMREGLVFKSNDSDLTFKVISNQYLLEKDS